VTDLDLESDHDIDNGLNDGPSVAATFAGR
jgi:hypothetical protein